MQLFDPQAASRIANNLLDAEAVKLRPSDPFIWASGWKSPIYCDNRLTLSYPQIRTNIKYSLAELVKLSFRGVQAIAGVATAGIAQGALTADLLNLPFLYVRSKAKGHGMENLIEGKVEPGQKVVVIEDLVSTGGSSIKAALALREAGVEVLGLAAIFTYGFPEATANFEKEGIATFCLSDYNTLIQEAIKIGRVPDSMLPALEKWREDPASWQGV